MKRGTLVGGIAGLAVAVIALMLYFGGAAPIQYPDARPDPMPFTLDLLAAMARAERITVTEHSYEYDFDSDETARATGKVTYASVDLNAQQKSKLRMMIAAAEEALQAAARVPEPPGGYAVTACIFDPHHTITFVSSGKSDGELSICFECSKLAWNSDTGVPQSLMGDMSNFITHVGLRPKRDWHELARQAAAGLVTQVQKPR